MSAALKPVEHPEPDYQPFPTGELEALARYHDSAGRVWSVGSHFREWHESQAKHCRNAIASYVALNQRCLEAETLNVLLCVEAANAATA